MSGRVSDVEYVAIRDSWRRAPREDGPWTLGRILEACHANLKEAAQREPRLRAELDRMAPGDPRIHGDSETPSMYELITAAVCDQKHWREYINHYRGRVASEGEGKVPSMQWRQGTAPRALPPVPADRRLPREEDDSDSDLPF